MKFRPIFGFFLAAAGCFAAATPAGALGTGRAQEEPSTITIDSISYKTDPSSRTASVTAYDGDSAEVTIPASIPVDSDAAYAVTAIDEYAFYGSDDTLKRIVLPDGVKNLGQSAFARSEGLTEVVLPDSISAMSTFTFAHCTSLKSVSLPGSLRVVPASSFEGCTSLASVAFPHGLEAVQTKAFKDCAVLESVALPESIAALGQGAFAGVARSLQVAFGGTPMQWHAATGGTEKWLDSTDVSHRAVVACAMPADQIEHDVVYTPADTRWTAVLATQLPPGWTLSTLPQSGGGSPKPAGRANASTVLQVPLAGPEGTRNDLVLRAVSKGQNVTASAEAALQFETGWTPQDADSWITISSCRPISGDEIEIVLKPKNGTVESVLSTSSQSTGTFVLTAGNSRCITSSDGVYHTYRAKVAAPDGADIQLELSGTFEHDNGHGTFDVRLPVIKVSPAPKPTPTAEPAPEPTPTPTVRPDPTKEPAPSPTPTPSASEQPSPTPPPTQTPAPSPSADRTSEPSADPTPSPEPSETQPPAPTSGTDTATPGLKDDSDFLIAGVGGESMLKGTMPNGADMAIDAGTLKSEFDVDHGIIVEILDHSGLRVQDHMPLATGYQIVFRRSDNSTIISRFPVVVQGDVCGTGYMSLTQLVRHAQGYTGARALTGCYLSAGDFNDNGALELSDLVREAQLFRQTQ